MAMAWHCRVCNTGGVLDGWGTLDGRLMDGVLAEGSFEMEMDGSWHHRWLI